MKDMENVDFVKLKHEKGVDFVQYFRYIECMKVFCVYEFPKTFSIYPC